MRDADLTYADFARASIEGCDLRGSTVFRSNFHQTAERDAQFPDRAAALGTQPALAQAQAWRAGGRA